MLLDWLTEHLGKAIDPSIGERAGHKYVRRWQEGGKWRYDYADEPSEAHGLGAVPEVADQTRQHEFTNARTGETRTKEVFQVVPKSHSLEVDGAVSDVPPEQAYKAAMEKALAQPGTQVTVKHARLDVPCTLTVGKPGPNFITVTRQDKAAETMFTKKGDAASSKPFSSYAAYEHWFLQTSNTVTVTDPEGRPWFNVVPLIGSVNKTENKIEWSTDPERQYKLVYHPSFPEHLQKPGSRDGNAASLSHALKQLDDEYGAIEESLGRTPTKGKFSVQAKPPADSKDTASPAAAEAPEKKEEPVAAEKTEEPAEPLNFKKLPAMDEVMLHPSIKWTYNHQTRERELAVSPKEKTALIQHAAKQYWGKLVDTAAKYTNTPFFAGNKREVMSEWIGQELPESGRGVPDHVFLLPDSVGYKAIESALDLYNPKMHEENNVTFTGWLAGGKGKLNGYFADAQRAATDDETRIQRTGADDEEGGKNDLSNRGATDEEMDASEHLAGPERVQEKKQQLDPKVILPKLIQALSVWEQTRPEKAAVIQEAKAAMRAIRTSPESSRAERVSNLLAVLSDAGMGKDLGLTKSIDIRDIVLLAAQQSVIRKALDYLTRDKDVDPTHAYSHKEGDDSNPRFFYTDESGNLVRYTNAPSGQPDRADFYGDPKLHPSEPLFDKNPEYFSPDGKKLNRSPDGDGSAVEWNSKYNRYDPKNLWAGRWRDPNSGEMRYTYVHADIRRLPKLAINQQNTLTDARLPGLRQYYSDLFNKSDRLKDQITAVALALLDQGKVRAVELAVVTSDMVTIDGSLITLGSRKIYADDKVVSALQVMQRTTPAGMPLFSVPSQGRDKVDGNIRRMLGPHYLSRVLDQQGVSLLGLQTYHATVTFSREVERMLTLYRVPWDQAVQQALLISALEWGHDFTQEADPLRILQLVQEVLVDPITVQVLQQNAKSSGVMSGTPAQLSDATIPVPYVSLDLTDLTAGEKEFSNWLHTIPIHDYAEIPPDVSLMKGGHDGLVPEQKTVTRDGHTFQETFYTRPKDGASADESATQADDSTDASSGADDDWEPAPLHKKLNEIENQIIHATDEHAKVVDDSGNVIFEKKGSKSEVVFDFEDVVKFKGHTLTHNHPNGSSLSFSDLSLAAGADLAELRAVGKNKISGNMVYAFVRPDNGWASLDTKAVDYWATAHHAEIIKEFDAKIRGGFMTKDEANASHMHEVWKRTADKCPELNYVSYELSDGFI